VRGGHTYGDGFGAGRGHKGADVFADCGTTLVAARAGKVQYKAYQGSGAGYYVVIDGKGTNKDYVYMHLRGPANVGQGDNVKTGKVIGDVGDSGNATGCHLHFELWKGDWFGGGSPMRSVMKHLKRWDRWG
jgi:murein DD-endopeptidase MepM/ murein hydrolase activator NlpD